MAFFGKLFGALKKTKENVSTKLRLLFAKNKLGDEFYDELEEILISADVSVRTAEDIIEQVKEEAIGEKLKDQNFVIDLLKDILQDTLEQAETPKIEYPAVIMLVGVNGVGKTTTIGKLAHWFKAQGKSVVLAAGDTFRAAAAEQLEVWGERAGVRVIRHEEGSDPAAVVYDAIASAKAKNTDVVLIDTAGRLQNKKNLMNELAKINKVVGREYPDCDYRTYIVIDATTGQNALSQVEAFDEIIDMDGIILNKLDGTAKGGVVFAISAERELPVVFVGVGEGIDDLEEFDAESFIDALFE